MINKLVAFCQRWFNPRYVVMPADQDAIDAGVSSPMEVW